MAISEEELERRLKLWDTNATVAGPDHPINSGGLQTSLVPRLHVPVYLEGDDDE